MPAAVGAGLLVAVVGIRMLLAAPALLRSRDFSIGSAILGLAGAAAGGAAGGLVHGFFGDRLLAIGRIGPYVWGIACVTAYMFGLAVVAPVAFGETLIHNGIEAAIYAALGMFFGLCMGYGYARQP